MERESWSVGAPDALDLDADAAAGGLTTAGVGGDGYFSLDDGLCGLPLDLGLVGSAAGNDEFDLDEHRSTVRSLDVLPPPAALSLAPPPALVQARPLVVPALARPQPSAGARRGVKAPPLPPFHKSPGSQFQCTTPLAPLLDDVRAALATHSVHFTVDGDAGSAFECEAFVAAPTAARVEFSVAVFALSDGRHQVEFQRLCGCRCAYGHLLARLADTLRSCADPAAVSAASPTVPSPLLHAPPLPPAPATARQHQLQIDALVETLLRTTAGETAHEAAARGLARVVRTQPPADPHAVVALLAALQARLKGTARTPAQRGAHLAGLATLADLAVHPTVARHDAALAHLEALVAGPLPKEWLEGGDCPHLKREAVRLLAGLVRHPDPAVAARFAVAVVRAGLVPSLEVESSLAREDGVCPDVPLADLAKATVVACR